MTAAAFKGTALFVWSRHRTLIVAAFAVHVVAFLVYDYLWAEQRTGALFLNSYLRAAPFFLPLLLFTSAVNVATADLGGGESWYPRQLFTLPLTTRGLALPFMTYTVGLYALLWMAAAFITDGQTPMDQARTVRPQPWEPFLDLALLALLQAAIWRPFSIRWARLVLLFVVVAAYFGGFIVSSRTGLSATVLAGFLAALAALAYLAGFHGIARARTGAAGGAPRAARPRPSDTRSFPSTLHAQRWFERHVQRGRGTVVAAFIVAFVFLTGALLFLFGTFAISDPRPLAMQAATLFFWTLLIIGWATGPAFAAFNVRAVFADGNAFRMPSFFAALPMATGDFAWAKLATAARRMALLAVYLLAASASLLALAAWAIAAEPYATSEPWWGLAEVVERHGALEVTVLAAGGVCAFLALSGVATANLVWVGLFGRGWKIASTALTIVVVGVILAAPWLAANPTALARVNAALPTVFAALAVLKLAALALLAYVAGARRLYPWARLGGIALAWAAAIGVCAFVVLRYAPDGLIKTGTLLASLVVLLPVLGIVAAPLALQANRCR